MSARGVLRALILFVVAILIGTGLVAAPTAAAAPGCANQRSQPKAVSAGVTPVILVHGWTGQPSNLDKLRAYLDKALGSSISLQSFDYSQDSTRWAANPAIASCLAHFVHGVTDKNHVRAVLVSHSMGGLAIRFASSARYTDRPIGKQQIARVITIDTPHRGSLFGGNLLGEVGQFINELRSRGRFPPAGSDGARCLAIHSETRRLPAGCAAPPYMPPVDLTSISGQNTVVRTLFGRELYRIDQQGDGIVPATSQAGYPGSAGNPTPTGYRLSQPDVTCPQTTDQTLAIAGQLVPPVPTRVLGTWARAVAGMLADSQTIADISAGKVTPFSAASWLMTALTSKCGHDGMKDDPRTWKLVRADVERALALNRIGPDITEKSVGELLVPAGTCGDGTTIAWEQVNPIQLRGGQGESFDSELVGAGILDTRLVGTVDITGDGRDEAVVTLRCTGSRRDMCCAGRTSSLDFVVVLDLSNGAPRRVGDTIVPVDVPGPNGYDESRSIRGEDVTLDGTSVVTQQTLVYPDELDPGDVARLEGEVRYSLRGDRWVPSP